MEQDTSLKAQCFYPSPLIWLRRENTSTGENKMATKFKVQKNHFSYKNQIKLLVEVMAVSSLPDNL